MDIWETVLEKLILDKCFLEKALILTSDSGETEILENRVWTKIIREPGLEK